MPPASRHAFWPYLGTSIAFGSTFYLIKIVLHTMTPLGSGCGRCLFGALTLLVVAKRRSVSLPRGAAVWRHLFVVALLASVIPGVLVPLAETHVTSALAGLTAGMIPLTTLLFLVTVFREERVHPHQLVGLVVGFAGLIVVTGIWHGLGANPWWAVLALLATIISYGAAFPYIKHYITPLGLNPLSLATAQQLLSAGVLLLFLPFLGFNGHTLTLTSTLAVLALGVFAGGFAFMWNFQTVEALGSSIASTVEYTAALVAVLAGVFLLHERLYWYQPVGGVIVLVGAMIGWGQLRLPEPLRRA
jgi:drug/metabolite transporter (DMT)-like permease